MHSQILMSQKSKRNQDLKYTIKHVNFRKHQIFTTSRFERIRKIKYLHIFGNANHHKFNSVI